MEPYSVPSRATTKRINLHSLSLRSWLSTRPYAERLDLSGVGDVEAGIVKDLLQKLPSLQEGGLQLKKWPAGSDFGFADGSDKVAAP